MHQAFHEGIATRFGPFLVTVPLSLRPGVLSCTAQSTGPVFDAQGTSLRLPPFSHFPHNSCPCAHFSYAQSKTRNKIWIDVPHRHRVVRAGKQDSARVLPGARFMADLWMGEGES
jgi:hypothetical protein